jgi:serine/threonine protein kinase
LAGSADSDAILTLPQDEAAQDRARQLSLSEDQPPAGVPGYHIQRKIGEGRYGSVWMARELNTGKLVAIKFYAQRRGVDWSLLGREVEKLAVLYTSRNIVGLLAVGWDHDPPYYVMEFLGSGSLADRLAQGPLPVPEAVRITTGIAQALVHAHGSGILHCDLKPANILLDRDGEPRLCDFGQSRLVDERSSALGTLYYMAPEQADLKAVPDARWDVYGLGALLYHMLTGGPPHRTPATDAELLRAEGLVSQLAAYRRTVTDSPKPTQHRRVPGVDSVLADLIDHCLAPSPADRLTNAQAVLDRLEERERQRSRRPMMVFGLLLPILLLLCTAPLAWRAMYDAVSTARSNLTRRALESDVLSVNLLANNLEHDLVDRRDEFLRIAADPQLREFVAQYARLPRPEERRPLFEKLEQLRTESDKHRAEAGRTPDTSWFLQDAAGIQRWRDPASNRSMDRNYSFRDYFHGTDAAYTKDDSPSELAPIREPHLSRPYLSTSTDAYTVSLTVPIWDADQHEVIGVLGRSIKLSQLLVDYEDALLAQGADGVGRVLSLIDGREWRLIAHSGWKTEDGRRTMERKDFERLTISDDLAGRLAQLPTNGPAPKKLDRTASYSDPMGAIRPDNYSGEWMAAFSPVGETGWIAVVQERRAAVFAAVEDLRTRMLLFGASAVLVGVVVVASCWWLIVRAVNETPPHRS